LLSDILWAKSLSDFRDIMDTRHFTPSGVANVVEMPTTFGTAPFAELHVGIHSAKTTLTTQW
jgi:hypothetical protein